MWAGDRWEAVEMPLRDSCDRGPSLPLEESSRTLLIHYKSTPLLMQHHSITHSRAGISLGKSCMVWRPFGREQIDQITLSYVVMSIQGLGRHTVLSDSSITVTEELTCSINIFAKCKAHF